MLELRDLHRTAETVFRVALLLDGKRFEFTAEVTHAEESLRSVAFRGLSDEAVYELTNSDEYPRFARTFWRVVDGEAVMLPIRFERTE